MEDEVGNIRELMAQERNIYSLQTGAITMDISEEILLKARNRATI